MTKRDAGRGAEHEPTRITVTDKRRIDPSTGEVRDPGLAAAGADRVISGGPNPADPAIPPAGTAAASVADVLAAAQSETAERTADLQRITAEYANYRKRADRDRLAAASLGRASVVGDLLAVLDDVDRAEEHGDLTGAFKTVADKLAGILEKVGLSHFGADGDEFDPNVHEAVQFATSADVQHATVTAVLRRGYLFEERVLRPAVVVVTGPEHADGTSEAGDTAGDVAGEDVAGEDAAAE